MLFNLLLDFTGCIAVGEEKPRGFEHDPATNWAASEMCKKRNFLTLPDWVGQRQIFFTRRFNKDGHDSSWSGLTRVVSGMLTGPPIRWLSKMAAIISMIERASIALHRVAFCCSMASIRSRMAATCPPW